MNIFYAPPDQIEGDQIELTQQEARHAARVLRYREGDTITVVDGEGGWYEGIVCRILRNTALIEITNRNRREQRNPSLVMAMGIIKKRDRLEFAVEKAVELGVGEIVLFRSEHTVKENVRVDRLRSTAVSAMKQSLRACLPSISVYPSVREVIGKYSDSSPMLVARGAKDTSPGVPGEFKKMEKEIVLFVGPEGGFSQEEIALFKANGARIVSLGSHRLRTETAVVALLSQFLR
ncbi:RsmE family RNA methyltransferase [Halalkalibaculum sp. DA384]|uniref:RsmE family RNA methyltransferase n=1 Tax=Halalkalibaculum sp. DA384 TaxID=3373606 RepID=UPI003754B598